MKMFLKNQIEEWEKKFSTKFLYVLKLEWNRCDNSSQGQVNTIVLFGCKDDLFFDHFYLKASSVPEVAPSPMQMVKIAIYSQRLIF